MAAKSFDDTNGNGITRDASLDSGDTFDSRAKNTNYGGTGGANITTSFYQGTGAAGRKIGSTDGMGFTVGNYTSRDQTAAAYRHVIPKMWITNIGALNPAGMDFGVGSGTGTAIGNNQHWWTVADDGTIPAPGFEIPAKGGFVIKPIDTQLRAYLRGSSGTPVETAMVNFMAWVDLVNTGGTDRNLIIDSPDYVETGFHVVGGDGGDADIEFADFVAEDEGEVSTNFDRVGLWQTNEGIIQFFGTNVVGRTYGGTVTNSAFTDSFKTLVCPGGYAGAGFNALEFDIGDASTLVSLDNISVTGSGRSGLKRLFDATDSGSGGDVNVTDDEITYTAHGFSTGECVLYSREGNTAYVTGAAANGESELVTGTTGEYYYAIFDTVDTFAVASSFANALAGTRLALTAQSAETHSFTRTPDNRPDFIVTGDATPGTMTMGSCLLNSCREITFVDGLTYTGGSIVSSGKLFHGDGAAVINGTAIIEPTVYTNESFIETEDLDNISNTTWSSGSDGGHGIYLNPVGDGPGGGGEWTFAWAGNEASGYYEVSSDGSTGNTFFLVDNNNDNDVTINVSGTTSTWRYERAAGYTGTVSLVNAVTLTLTGIRTDSEVRIINLEDTTNFNKELGGSEQISGSLQSLTIIDGGTGYAALDTLTVVGGTGTAATITVDAVDTGVITAASVNTAGSYTVDPTNPAGVTGGTGNDDATFNLDISGEFAYGYDAGSAVRVAIIVFHLNFIEVRLEQELLTSDQSIPIQQRGDRTFNNP